MFDDQKRRSALSGGHNVARRTLFLTLLASNFYQFYALFSV